MKNSYKAVLLSALGLTAASAAYAGSQSDLLLGLTDWSASTPTDYILDIGAQSGFTANSTASGSFSSLGTTFSTLDSGYQTDQTVAGTVAGVYSSSYPKNLYVTADPTLYGAPGNATYVEFDNAISQAGGIGGNTLFTPGLSQTAISTTQSGISYYTFNGFDDGIPSGLLNNKSTGNEIGQSVYAVADSSGIITEDLYEESQNTSATTAPGAWTELGVFTIDLTQDSWTYNGVSAVPEPTTYGLLAGAGLLALTMRRQFKKNA